jgi:UDP-3-O-[3-hydroxymyristoyl] glucosamine N-acyltransferase
VAELAALVGGTVEGDGSLAIAGLASLNEAGPGDISFLVSAKYASRLAESHAGAVIVPLSFKGPSQAVLVRCKNPDAAMARIAEEFAPPGPRDVVGVHPSAVVSSSARIAVGVSVGPLVVIEDEAEIGEGTVIRAGSYVGRGVRVGRQCLVYPQVTIREGTQIGDRVILHSGVVLGADGFGYVMDSGRRLKVPQIGRVMLEDDVEIGANTTVDRARFGETRIGRGVKIDNLVQIAHNVKIGADTVIVSLCAIAGSTTLGQGCVLGGQVAVDGHLTLGDRVMIAAKSGVTKDWPSGSVISGFPAQDHRADLRLTAELRKLAGAARRLDELERKLSGPVSPERKG